MHLAPDQVWGMDPVDLATVIDELNQQAKRRR